MSAGRRDAAATLVVQSFRPDPPEWVARCLDSARAWAADAGFAYRFVGDELFDLLPGWVRDKTAARPMVASDLARLLLIEAALAEGWDAVVWLDADVLVSDPARLTAALDLPAGYLLGREAWVQPDYAKRARPAALRARKSVHNALLAAAPGNAFLPFYREAATRILARHDGPMVPQLIGPKLLTALDNMIGLPATWAVNMASPLVLRDLAEGGGPALDLLYARSEAPPAALNLCQSLAGAASESDGVTLSERTMLRAIARSMAGAG